MAKFDVSIEDGELKIKVNIFEWIGDMTDEEKMQVVEAVTWGPILNHAVDRLTGESLETYGGDDELLTLDVLTKMEEHLLSGYKWTVFKELQQVAKDISSHQHLYWKMHHDELHGEFFRAWLRESKIESNYTHKLPDFVSFSHMVEEKLEEFGDNLPKAIETTESA